MNPGDASSNSDVQSIGSTLGSQKLSNIIQLQNDQIKSLLETVKKLTDSKLTVPTKVSTKPIGLFGETNVPASLSAFPLLTGNTALHYSEWARKCRLHFTNTGLTEIITTDPQTSFNEAIIGDDQEALETFDG